MLGWNLSGNFGSTRGLCIAAMVIVGSGMSAAQAQTVIDAGKTAPQLFASDCSPCHKTPQGLAKGSAGLSGFLRQHYTASRENADALASYLSGVGDAKAPPPPRKREAKPAAKPEDGKTGDAKTEAKPAAAKSEDKPVSDSKPAEAKPAEAKPAESKPAESKPADAPAAKPAE
jgi:hypothetical protein